MKNVAFFLAALFISASLLAQNKGKAEFDKGLAAYTKQDYAAAQEPFKQAAAKGDSAAMGYLGFMYEYGQGVAKDYQTAVSWYQKSSAKEERRAQFQLAGLYAKGLGVDIDTVKALELYKRAANNGAQGAMMIVGNAYETGLGAPQNYAEARLWYNKIGAEYAERADKRIGFMQAAKASGKPLKFSSVHNFKAAFLPGYNQVVLHAAQSYEAYANRVYYTDVDYRIIDLKTMAYRSIIKKPYSWITDYNAITRSKIAFSDMVYRAAFEVGAAPDSLRARQYALVKPYLMLNNSKYMKPEWDFLSRLNDGSLIYAVVNKKWSSRKADIILYRQQNAMSDVLEKYFVIPGIEYPELNLIISENGKRLVYRDDIHTSKCPVYDIPSGKKVGTVDLRSDWVYMYNGIVKFTPGGDSLVTVSHRDLMSIAVVDIKTGKATVDIKVPTNELDENSEEYGFEEHEKYANILRDKAPYIMDITADGKQVLVATTNKLAIINMDGSPAKFITSPGLSLYDAIVQRVYEDRAHKKLSADRTAMFSKIDAEVERRYSREYAERNAAGAARREANEAAIAEYRRTHPYGNTTDSKPAGSSNASAQTEAERHRKAMDQIYRDTEKMNKRFAQWKD
ncbi:tetratricopeptide repeat protein [Mucilaginibacter pedocola]|uniref:Sel1 repeat protein n=1 Tax=Mucilaginibacter pedocola TaxID=1792845 RepID=A0A1S9PDQ5_9SPHI|nr:tetratricopeptide repeat protein [Mucilaginibacter pedocola]OOQ58718.1 hypothetical protein BC343_08635 [Mucilaginibacter pedocola]